MIVIINYLSNNYNYNYILFRQLVRFKTKSNSNAKNIINLTRSTVFPLPRPSHLLITTTIFKTIIIYISTNYEYKYKKDKLIIILYSRIYWKIIFTSSLNLSYHLHWYRHLRFLPCLHSQNSHPSFFCELLILFFHFRFGRKYWKISLHFVILKSLNRYKRHTENRV